MGEHRWISVKSELKDDLHHREAIGESIWLLPGSGANQFAEKARREGQERWKVTKNYAAFFLLVGRRDGFCCASCGAVRNLELDHIRPVSEGGLFEESNLQLLCEKCNHDKGTRTIDYSARAGGDV